jgi:hypothetical protein
LISFRCAKTGADVGGAPLKRENGSTKSSGDS